jgi:hypothetical protein
MPRPESDVSRDRIAELIDSAFEGTPFEELPEPERPWKQPPISHTAAAMRKLLRANTELTHAPRTRESEMIQRNLEELQHALRRLSARTARAHRQLAYSGPHPGLIETRAETPPALSRPSRRIGFDFGIAVGAGIAGGVAAVGGVLLVAALSGALRSNPYTALSLLLVGLSLFGTVLAAVIDRRRG